MTALEMRTLARETVFACGGRGFMRFADSSALLVCDAARRCTGEGEIRRLISALEAKGFSVLLSDGLLMISPGEAMLNGITIPGAPEILWDSPLFAAQALAARLLKAPELPLGDAGRALAIEVLRLTGRPGEDVLSGLGALRERAAVMLRDGDRSGMRLAGAILAGWCEEQKKEETA